MTQFGRPAHTTSVGFTEARAVADRAEAVQRRQAARTVADHSLDVGDCRELLSMLGLSGRQPDAAAQDATSPHRDAPGAFRSTEGARP
ncbi:hypothetical protein [Saccharothrix syringae]|uniref:Uncharacterized protein n=1 Tax=Saccharothrix syringae TaxID=103733 RepID=A0A5Q0HAP4_SACSY|nr:hypothetical protein [Saccharothrix syringae]QFZ23015.1 hypothetical protein EKG83_41265 [Saccharothrix syringae]